MGRPVECSTGPGSPIPIASRSRVERSREASRRSASAVTQLSTASGPSATLICSRVWASMPPVRSLTPMRTCEAPMSTPSTTRPLVAMANWEEGRPPVETASPTEATSPSFMSASMRMATVERASPVIVESSVRVRGRPSRRIWKRSLAIEDPRALMCRRGVSLLMSTTRQCCHTLRPKCVGGAVRRPGSRHYGDGMITATTAGRIGTIDRRLFGGFVEHLGRHIYDGIYEPGHPSTDADGFRRDVIALVKELGVTTIRYPGGNFVSGFRWEDSVGPRAERPRRLDLAWHSTETNEVGLHEFSTWLEKVGSELMLAVNLGTRGVAEALELLEYTNIPGGTTTSELRRANGRERPFDVRMWCLGNEMDGPWQLGHRSADDYGKLAAQTAKAMRQLDPELELVVCGSSSRDMPTFGSWERTVLGHSYDDVDFISCHAYYQERGGDRGSFLASGVDMDLFIEEVVAVADKVGAA